MFRNESFNKDLFHNGVIKAFDYNKLGDEEEKFEDRQAALKAFCYSAQKDDKIQV